MDDAASFPRACLDTFRAGRAVSRVFLAGANRERILAGVGQCFFGSGAPTGAGTRRKLVKELFNSLDNDGEVGAWRLRCAARGHAVRAGARAADAC